MTWNNVPCHYSILFYWTMESWITFLSRNAMTKLRVMKKIHVLSSSFSILSTKMFWHHLNMVYMFMYLPLCMYIYLIVFVQDTLKHASVKDWTQDLMKTCSCIHHDVYFLNCICTNTLRHASIKDWTQDLMETYWGLNHQINSTHY
jgi:L-lactate permease